MMHLHGERPPLAFQLGLHFTRVPPSIQVRFVNYERNGVVGGTRAAEHGPEGDECRSECVQPRALSVPIVMLLHRF